MTRSGGSPRPTPQTERPVPCVRSSGSWWSALRAARTTLSANASAAQAWLDDQAIASRPPLPRRQSGHQAGSGAGNCRGCRRCRLAPLPRSSVGFCLAAMGIISNGEYKTLLSITNVLQESSDLESCLTSSNPLLEKLVGADHIAFAVIAKMFSTSVGIAPRSPKDSLTATRGSRIATSFVAASR